MKKLCRKMYIGITGFEILDAMKNIDSTWYISRRLIYRRGLFPVYRGVGSTEKGTDFSGPFIPVAEKEGFIRRIKITTRLVIEQIVRWREAGGACIRCPSIIPAVSWEMPVMWIICWG